MCIFSQPVDLVGSTRIFMSSLPDGRHATIYQMAYAAREDVAMILPAPVRPGGGDDALEFVDLRGYRDFFERLDRCCFPAPRSRAGAGGGGYGGGGEPIPRPRLVVHDVGDFIASYVPSIGDFDRLEPCFRLPPAAWETLPDYAGFGFAVFQLRPGVTLRGTHPIAYRYPPTKPEELYFPTAHLHDGDRAEPRALFDHALYAQPDRQHRKIWVSGWEFSPILPSQGMDPARAGGLLAGDVGVGRFLLTGVYPNADLVLKLSSHSDGRLLQGTTEFRLARVPWDMGPTLNWEHFLAFGQWMSPRGGYD